MCGTVLLFHNNSLMHQRHPSPNYLEQNQVDTTVQPKLLVPDLTPPSLLCWQSNTQQLLTPAASLQSTIPAAPLPGHPGQWPQSLPKGQGSCI